METKEMKGITLVALVVTIVVLLILAGVSINLVLGDNGIITRAKEAREKSAEATENDLKGLNGIIDQIDATLEESTYPETVPYLPSDDFHYDESTSIDTGLVIQDSDGNEYVWVVVPRRKSIYKTTGLGKTEFIQEDYASIQNDLDNYVSRPHVLYHPHTIIAYDNDDYYNMLKSIYLNGGFYVGRYEAGIATNRTSNAEKYKDNIIEGMPTPLSKADLYPYTYITKPQACKLAESINSGNYTSSLWYGIQFDLTLKFMCNDTAKITSPNEVLYNNGESIANFRDSSFDLYRGKYAQCGQLSGEWNDFDKELGTIVVKNDKTGKMQKTAQSETKNSILLTTGATEHSRVMNIYDIAGNVDEWLLEHSINAYGNPCIFVGGSYTDFKRQVYCCGPWTESDSASDIGFRVAIY